MSGDVVGTTRSEAAGVPGARLCGSAAVLARRLPRRSEEPTAPRTEAAIGTDAHAALAPHRCRGLVGGRGALGDGGSVTGLGVRRAAGGAELPLVAAGVAWGYRAAMNEKIQRELHNRIEAFAAEITEILQRAVAGSVAEVLGGPVKTRPSARAGVKAVNAPAVTRAKARAVMDRDVLLREVRRQGGRRMEELGKALRATTKVLRGPMKQLIAEKKVKTSGQARGTRYRAA